MTHPSTPQKPKKCGRERQASSDNPELDSQIVSFSGDSVNAFMDIQIGKGPLAPSANGLVRIGKTMTMVISATGDPGLNFHELIEIYPGKYAWSGEPEQGDCSLKILSASRDLDDGEWECQVTASTPDSFDFLSFSPAHLYVRVSIEYLVVHKALLESAYMKL
ncbi:hypothetical protein QYM36_003308 [Artemia franciscana]|uniref:Ig-like domain-containing protein n=1 Tax=Artemia franciscana TaxID=6661 RepID=A0AA88IJX0_ARTSF|nr:hypothetical protein QYM36_003308 [Artemia franciscana]